MNTETIVHPKLHHLGLTTANLKRCALGFSIAADVKRQIL
jgi:hypothetical protein